MERFYILLFFLFLSYQTTVLAQEVDESISLDGLVEPNELIELGSQVPGILDEVLVERGDRVEQGQVVVRLKSGVERVAIELARARLDFSRRRAERNEELFKKELISIHDKDEMETEIHINELQLKDAIERLEMRTVRSPFDGVVVERFLAQGEYVGIDPILTIASIDPLNVEVIVPQEHFNSIKKGMTAEVHLEEPVGGVYTATVIIVDQVIDAASGTFGVCLELPNPSYKLPAGLRCNVRFIKYR